MSGIKKLTRSEMDKYLELGGVNPSNRSVILNELDSNNLLKKPKVVYSSEVADKVGDTFIDFNNDSPSEQWTKIFTLLRDNGFVVNRE